MKKSTVSAGWLLGTNHLRTTAFNLMSERIFPQGNIRSDVSAAILTPFFHRTWETVETTLPYVRPFIKELQEQRLDTENIFTAEGTVNTARVDHYANRHLKDPTVSPVDSINHNFPQFHPLAGDKQTRIILTMVGMEPVGDHIAFPERAVKGGGYISKNYPDTILPRWFTSEQDLNSHLLPRDTSRTIKASIRGAEKPLYDATDWELLIAADEGKKLTPEECRYLSNVTLPKMLVRNYTPNPETLDILREAERQKKLWAEYTRNCYERGSNLNHGTIPVSDIPRASAIMHSLGIPTVPDQGVGTQLEQGAAGSTEYPLFLEYIHRIWTEQYHPNGEPIWEENGFTFNANGIFAATSQAQEPSKPWSERPGNQRQSLLDQSMVKASGAIHL